MPDTAVIFLYGDYGTGKTLQWARMLWGAFAITPPGELKTLPGTGFVGAFAQIPYRQEYTGWTLFDLCTYLEKLQEALKGQPYPYMGLVFECINYVIADTMRLIEARAPKSRSGNVNKFQVDSEIKAVMDRFRGLVRTFNTNVVFTSHERSPVYEDRQRKSKGGAFFPTRTLANMLITWCDSVFRVTQDPYSPDPYAKICFEVNPMGADDDYPTKERHGVGRLRKLPPSLREVMLACNQFGFNYVFPRLPGLEWQDSFAEELAQGLAAGNQKLQATMYTNALQQGLARPYVEWAVSDGIARYQLRKGIKALDQPSSAGEFPGLNLGSIPGIPGIPSSS